MAQILQFPGASAKPEKPDFGKMYDEYYNRLYKYTYTILFNREDTEDVVSETFMTAMAAYDSFDPEKASLATWLTRIAHNKAVNLVRSAAYRKRAEMPEYYDVPDTSGEGIASMDDKETVMYLYSKLSSDEREFLNFRYAMGMKDGEIADLLGLPVKTVNKRYQRLLKKCKDILEGEP